MAEGGEATLLLCAECDAALRPGNLEYWLERVTVGMTVIRDVERAPLEVSVCAHILAEAIVASGTPEVIDGDWRPPANYIWAMFEGADDVRGC